MKTLHALFVAIDDYPNPQHALNGCANDLRALKTYLKAYCEQAALGFNSQVLLNQEASRANVIAGFDLFQQAAEGDSCLFFYAGHGAYWAAPEAFWHIEPDRYNESLVLHDSRTEGGRDLMDKELSYLIWKATHGRDVHFVAITDCCHSGTITRLALDELPKLRERRAEPMDASVPVEAYLGIEEYPKTAAGEIAPPRGRYVHLAASRANQTAKEVYARNQPRGAFSYFLEATLRSTGGHVSYAELLQRINIYLGNQVREQSPQLDATEAADKNLAFLSGSTALEQGQLLLSYSREHHWNVNAGAMHQVQAASEPPTQFELIGENRTVAAEKVLLHRCTVGGMEGHDKSAVYPVRMIPAPPERLRIAFALGSDEEGQKMLRQMILNKASQLYQLEAEAEQAQYLIHCRDEAYFLTTPYDDRPLFKRTPGYSEAAATDFLNQLETITHWNQLLALSNPGTQIKDEEIRLELFRGTEAGNDQNDAPMEPLDWRETARMPYLYDGQEWQRPAFQLKLTNTGKRKLWCSVLFLSDDFSVSNQLMPMQELAPGEYAWTLEVFDGNTYRPHHLEMADVYQGWGISRISDYFKIIISTQEFETDSLNQEGLELERPASPTRRIRSRRKVSRYDWATKDIHLQIERPLPTLEVQAQRPARMYGISISPSEGWWANARWRTLEEATAGFPKHFNGYLPDGSFFCPAEMGPQASRPGLCVLEVWNVKLTASDAPAALHLTFEEAERKEGLEIYCWKSSEGKLVEIVTQSDGANALQIPMDTAWQDGEGKVQLFFHNSSLGGRVT